MESGSHKRIKYSGIIHFSTVVVSLGSNFIAAHGNEGGQTYSINYDVTTKPSQRPGNKARPERPVSTSLQLRGASKRSTTVVRDQYVRNILNLLLALAAKIKK